MEAVRRLVEKHQDLKKEIGKIIVGQDDVVDQVLWSIYTGGHSLLIGGLVDFETGDVLWLNREVSGGVSDLRDPQSARALARELMEGYPGLPERPKTGPGD